MALVVTPLSLLVCLVSRAVVFDCCMSSMYVHRLEGRAHSLAQRMVPRQAHVLWPKSKSHARRDNAERGDKQKLPNWEDEATPPGTPKIP